MDTDKINVIKRYLSQNDVKYYDVQAELIDHFATAVENQQRANPVLSFSEALHYAHQKFGGKEGFRKFKEQARSNVGKKTWFVAGKTALQFLRWPYFLLTSGFYVAWCLMIQAGVMGSDYTSYYLIFLGGFAIAFIVNEIYLRKIAWYLPRQSNRALVSVCYFLYYPPSMALDNLSNPNTYVLAAFFTLLTVFTICLVMVPRIMTREVQKIYKMN